MARKWELADRSSGNRGFTNRLTLDEEIEMSATYSPDSPGSRDDKDDLETPVDTPTTFTTNMGHNDVDLGAHSPNGSSVELAPKSDPGESKRGAAF